MASANVGGKPRRTITQTGDVWLAGDSVWRHAVGQSVRGETAERSAGLGSSQEKAH